MVADAESKQRSRIPLGKTRDEMCHLMKEHHQGAGDHGGHEIVEEEAAAVVLGRDGDADRR